jgi:MFS family permease
VTDGNPQLTRASPDPLPEEPRALTAGVLRRTVRSLRVDITPLRSSREYRLLFTGQGISFAGTMVTYVAVPFQAYALTHSSLVVGLLSLVELLPILAVALIGGALADAVDRRRMVRITEVAMCVVTAGLLVNAAVPHPQLWALFVGVGCAAAIDSLQRPSLDALLPRVVERDQLQAAAALDFLRGDLGMLLGPAIAGLLIAGVGLPLTYGVDVATFAASLLALSLMRAVPPPPGSEPVGLRSVRTSVRYAASRQDLLGSYLVDINAMLFGMPMALFPQIASQFGGAAVLGILYAAPAAGSFIASLASGWIRGVRHHGRAIAAAAACWGAAIVVFGVAPSLWIAVAALVLAGAADCVSGLFRTTLWNQTIPDSMRGRLAGIEMISYSSGPALGNVEAGIVAALTNVRVSVVSGGVACIAGTVVLCALLPAFWRYRADVSANA